MTRPLDPPPATVEPPAGVSIDTFQPGKDEQEWLDVNAAAFAGHPEQGGWTLDDLRDRMSQPWFDPAGFFVARRPGQPNRMVGFHWTKVHDDSTGEVYVVGVAPSEQGSGLGHALTRVGLHHLHGLGLREAILYVEEASAPAVRLYQSLGFTRAGIDVQYARPGT